MKIGDIIKNYRKENNLTLREFAKKCDLSYTYIFALEKDKDTRTGKPTTPSLDSLYSIAKGMNISAENLLAILDNNQEVSLSSTEVTSRSSPAVVLVYGKIPAGIPMEMIEDIIDTEEIPSSWLNGNKEYFGLKVNGTSMMPKYQNNDTIICLKCEDCESGDDCVVAVNGNDATFKKVIKNENGIILQPLNPSFAPLVYTNEDIKKLPVRILGKVVELRRKI